MSHGENLRDKVVKRWFGISGEFDEYKRQEVNRIGTNAFMLYIPIMLISLVLSGFIVDKQPENAVALIFLIQFGYFTLVICPYIMVASHRAHLTTHEIAAKDSRHAYLIIGRKMLFMAIYFGVFMYLEKTLLDYYFDGINFTHSLTQWAYISTGLWSGGAMGVVMGIQELLRLRKYR